MTHAEAELSDTSSSSLDVPPPRLVQTFETTSENIDVHLHTGKTAPAQDDAAERSRSRREFMRLLNEDTMRNARRPKTVSRKSHNPPAPRLSTAEVFTAADQVLKGKKVDVSNPRAVSDILTELDHRRVQFIERDEYLKSKQVADAMDNFKRQFYAADQEHMYNENRKRLEEKLKEGKDALESTTKDWKRKKSEFVKTCQKEIDQIQDRHDDEHAKLEAKWSSQSTKRRYSKRSPELLQQQAIERYMVLTGRLEEAEKLKARNRTTEKREAQERFKDMTKSFDGARAHLVSVQGDKIENVQDEQDFKNRHLLLIEQGELGVCRRRVSAVEYDIGEVNTVNKFVMKKFRRSYGSSIPVAFFSSGEDVDPFTRGKLNRSETHPNAFPVKAVPLDMPELQVKPMKTKRVSVSFKS